MKEGAHLFLFPRQVDGFFSLSGGAAMDRLKLKNKVTDNLVDFLLIDSLSTLYCEKNVDELMPYSNRYRYFF